MNCSNSVRLHGIIARSVAGAFLLLGVDRELSAEKWPPPEGVPLTRWAREVSPDRPVLSKYPRPQMVRRAWQNLNGPWDYAITAKEAAEAGAYQGKILVPFPPQAVLSQVNRAVGEDQGLWYHRTFEVPRAWAGQRVLLHFGAVNWQSRVTVNGKLVAAHTGGYDEFTCDITDALRAAGPQDLIVWAWNPVEGGQPHGKQSLRPAGITYTPTTGIWQTVWLEPVPASHIAALRIVPDVDHERLELTVAVDSPRDGESIEAVASAAGKEVARAAGKPNAKFFLAIPRAKLWWPASPFLYDLKVTLHSGPTTPGGMADEVGSYFGMRKISVAADAQGVMRIMLNNRPVFQNGLLDQGFWPDGVYTAPTDEALRFDLEMLRAMGFNMDRKHVKVEPERWYYWADRLGVLVWQDMPSTSEMAYFPENRGIPDKEGNYESELRRMIRGRINHPSIVMWVLFNEGWGLPLERRQSDKEPPRASAVAKARVARMIKAAREEDPSRLIDSESGTGGGGNGHREDLFDIGGGDVIDYHCYGHDGPQPEKRRAAVVGEYGWAASPLGSLANRMKASRGVAISGCVLTQLTDVENERNGTLKYDRTPARGLQQEKHLGEDIRRLMREYGYREYPGGEQAEGK
jgi:hypothetical protein